MIRNNTFCRYLNHFGFKIVVKEVRALKITANLIFFFFFFFKQEGTKIITRMRKSDDDKKNSEKI